MQIFKIVLLLFLVGCALAVSLTKNLFSAVLVYMAYSLVMSVIWLILESPDLGITEAAVGAGITSILLIVTLRKIDAIKYYDIEEEEDHEQEDSAQ